MEIKPDNREYATSLHRALVDDAFYIAMEASVDQNRMTPEEGMIRYMAYSMQEAVAYGDLVLPEKGTYGAAIWSKPLDSQAQVEQSKAKKEFLRREMGEKSLETYLAIVDFMSSAAEPHVDDSFWYLSIVGISPEFQGKGLGAPLITPVLEKTDALKVPTFLETFTPRNMSFYRHLGYEAAASFLEPVTRTEYWIMIRLPVK